jgi:hypothetical protein
VFLPRSHRKSGLRRAMQSNSAYRTCLFQITQEHCTGHSPWDADIIKTKVLM